MIYSYICQSCGQEYAHAIFAPIGGHIDLPCQCCGGLIIRRASFQFRRGMVAHFNQSTGTYVSNERQFKDGLKLASEEATARTGMEHNYVPVDVTDAKALGATDEGLEHTKKVRRDTGLDPASTTKVIY